MSRLYTIDTTLRDGEQTPGVAFNEKARIEIAKTLDNLGVDIIEVGIPIMGEDEIVSMRKINDLGLNSQLLTWNRVNKKDIDASLQTNIMNIHISVPASPILIEKKLRMSPTEVLLHTKEVIKYAIKKGCTVSLGAEDASRADELFLFQLYNLALEYGVTRVRYADTISKLNPFDTLSIIAKLQEQIDVPIDFHGHNDFGMATANALAAFKGGANYISCSINGLGERAGNTPLEEIVMALLYMEGCTTTVDTSKLYLASKLVESLSGRNIYLGKPIVGEDVFSHESGIHVDGLLKDKDTYAYLDPTLLGRNNAFILGKHSGKSAVMHIYEKMGLLIDETEANLIITSIRKSLN